MSISPAGSALPGLLQIPTALRASAHPEAARSAAGYGAASLASIQAITGRVADLLAKASGHGQGAGAAENSAGGARHDGPPLRPGNAARVQAAAMALQQAQGSAARLTPEAMLSLVLGSMGDMLKADEQRSVRQQFAAMQSRLVARIAQGERLSGALEAARQAAEAAQGAVGGAAGELEAALEALKAANAEVARLEAALANAPPEQQEALRAQLAAARAAAGTAETAVTGARGTLERALATAEAALEKMQDLLRESDALSPPLGRAEDASAGKRSAEAFVTEMLALLQSLVGRVNDALQKSNQKQIESMLEAKAAENTRRAKEYEDQVAKAEATQKKMGCIGKLVGWVLTVVAVVAAPFTGGGSMVLAGIGLALAIGEELGLDIMGKLLQPVMNLVMKLVKTVGGVLGSLLDKLGVAKDITNKIKDALAVVAVAAMIVGAVLLSRKLAGTVAVQAIMKAVVKQVSRLVAKVLPKMIQSAARTVASSVDDMAKAITKTVAKMVKSDADTLAVRAGQLQRAGHVMQFANQTAQGVGNIVVANMYVKAAEIRAAFELGLVDSRILRELMQRLLEYFVSTNDTVHALFEGAAELQDDNDRLARSITQRIAHA